MALPVLEKTYIFDVNNTISVGASSVGYGELLFQWKTFFITGSNAWTVVLSSDASTAGASDLWVNAAACTTHADPGGAHSWIVLQNDAISTGFQMLVNLSDTGGGGNTIMDTFISEAAGFTGGTTTNRPTATDEVFSDLDSDGQQWVDGLDLTINPAQFHMARSTDGEIWRFWAFVAGNETSLMSLEKPKAAVSGWTVPWVCVFPSRYSFGSDATSSYGSLNDLKANTFTRANSVDTRLFCTSEGAISSMLGQLQTSGADLDSGFFPFFPIGLFSDAAGSRGRLGALTDIWWGSTSPATGDHYPGDASRQFVQVGDLILPWDGGIAMLTT